jgi:hypothetical protein
MLIRTMAKSHKNRGTEMAARAPKTAPAPKTTLRSGGYAVSGKKLIWTVFANEGEKTLGGTDVQFYLDNVTDGSPETTRDADGLARHEFTLPKKKTFSIRAQLVGGAASCAEVIAIDTPAKSVETHHLDVRRSEVEFNPDGYSGAIVTAGVYNSSEKAIAANLEIVSSKLFVVVAPAKVCRINAAFLKKAKPTRNHTQAAPLSSFGVVCIEGGEYTFVVHDRNRCLSVDFKMPGKRAALQRPALNDSLTPWLSYFWKGGL